VLTLRLLIVIQSISSKAAAIKALLFSFYIVDHSHSQLSSLLLLLLSLCQLQFANARNLKLTKSGFFFTLYPDYTLYTIHCFISSSDSIRSLYTVLRLGNQALIGYAHAAGRVDFDLQRHFAVRRLSKWRIGE
jgi:hypothetical protein